MASKVGRIGNKLFVSNLPWTVANKQLKEYFSQFGHISKTNVVFDRSTGMSRGFGFITFSTEQSVRAVQDKAVHMLEGYTLNIRVADVPEQIE